MTSPASSASGLPEPEFSLWFAALRELAAEREFGWLAARASDSHQAAFAAGISPAEYLECYAGMAEWRGCGCGG